MIALCPYHLEMCNATEIIDIAFNHHRTYAVEL